MEETHTPPLPVPFPACCRNHAPPRPCSSEPQLGQDHARGPPPDAAPPILPLFEDGFVLVLRAAGVRDAIGDVGRDSGAEGAPRHLRACAQLPPLRGGHRPCRQARGCRAPLLPRRAPGVPRLPPPPRPQLPAPPRLLPPEERHPRPFLPREARRLARPPRRLRPCIPGMSPRLRSRRRHRFQSS
jgi:hypothetical protein